jgi:hypothetical protein
MRFALLSLLLLAGCASGSFGVASDNSGVAPVRLGSQDETHCRHMTVGESEYAYQQCVQKALEDRQEEAKAREDKAREAKAQEAKAQEKSPEANADKAEKTAGFVDQLQSATAAIFNTGR